MACTPQENDSDAMEEAASTAEELSGQAGELRQLVSAFQLSTETEPALQSVWPNGRWHQSALLSKPDDTPRSIREELMPLYEKESA
jgi:hypothetical protein